MTQDFSLLFAAAEQEVRAFLAAPETLSPEQSRDIIARYTAAIAGNFVPWMAAASVSVRSLQARFACEENITQEMHGDHPGLLETFARGANAEPTAQDHTAVADAVQNIRTLVHEMNGLKLLTLMACLERTSNGFIPFLADLAHERNSREFTYTNVHGLADAKHAEQFLWALSFEQNEYEDAPRIVEETVRRCVTFLRTILTVT